MVLSWSWKGTERTSLVACTFSVCRPPTCPATLTEVSQCNVTNLWVVFALHLQSALPSQRMRSALICCHLVLGIYSSVFCHKQLFSSELLESFILFKNWLVFSVELCERALGTISYLLDICLVNINIFKNLWLHLTLPIVSFKQQEFLASAKCYQFLFFRFTYFTMSALPAHMYA